MYPDGVFFGPLWDKKKPIRVREQATAESPQQLHEFLKEMQSVGGEGVFFDLYGVFLVPSMGFFLFIMGFILARKGFYSAFTRFHLIL